MATRRMLPTKFFKDPDVMALSSNDIRLILIGLILGADDEGRELAHTKLLGRELDYAPEIIEQALQELEANDLILLYQVGKHRYYSLTRWYEWQTLNKPTRSKYPAPPSEQAAEGIHQAPAETETATSQLSPDFPGESGKILETSGKPEKILLEGKVEEEEKRTESEEKGEDEGKVIPFPPPVTRAAASAAQKQEDQPERLEQMTAHIATLLKLEVTPPLSRLVAEFIHEPGLSLPGEADAAREWIDDPARNRKRQRMTLAFFRRWLKREREMEAKRQATLRQIQETKDTGSQNNRAGSSTAPAAGQSVAHRSLMHLEQEYRAALGQRGPANERNMARS